MYLGIEIGGTKLQLGVGTGERAEFIDFVRLDIDASQGAQGILNQIQQAGKTLVEKHHIKRVGYGFGGPIDGVAGIVRISHQVEGWEQFPLAEWTQETLGVPAVVRNDCDSAALAECCFGAGQSKQHLFYITSGTGVGGGLVLNRQLVGADRPAIAEIGHLRPGLEATDAHQTVESMASGRGIETWLRGQLENGNILDDMGEARAEILLRAGNDPSQITGKTIAAAAGEGNPLALEALDRATKALGWAVAQVVSLIAPEVVVIGGGVSLMGVELFLDPVRRYANQYVFPQLRNQYEIVPAALGEDVVVYGAIALAANAQ
ncbi:Glucokinase [Polystyrenella longa]|uniref:Glucokinase n=1 Tax=Polystyrenella longa TaxID=2528007 RepID=A0A518CGK0_9PLAN|nr:ROK family protein [Polystyrenella longa]QDU78353.1 Glucokinase [Polystyrenella longa]